MKNNDNTAVMKAWCSALEMGVRDVYPIFGITDEEGVEVFDAGGVGIFDLHTIDD